jgi:hypothetical protein
MATGGTMLYRALEQKLPKVLGKRYRELKFENGTIVPTTADLEPGAAEIVRETVDEIGDADIVGDGAFDIPVVDVSAAEDRYKIFMIASAFSYTFQQERAYEKGDAQINDRKMQLARRSIAERHNRIGAYGDNRLNVPGFLNNPSVILDNNAFDPYNVNTTPEQIAAFFIDTIKALHAASNNVEMPSDCLISVPLYFLLIKLRMSNSSMTLMEYIEKALSDNEITFDLLKCEECNSAALEARGVQAAGTNKDRIVLYPKDPEVVERHIELPKLMPQEWVTIKEGRRVYPMFSCTTQTVINYPGAIRYIDIIKGS